MNGPKISWFVVNNNEEKASNEYYAGTYYNNSPIKITLQAWNNRGGISDVEDVREGNLLLFFDNIEDSTLFNFCNVYIDGQKATPVVNNDKLVIKLPKVLSGKSNDGDSSKAENRNNYLLIEFEFDATGTKLKTEDIKNIFFEIVEEKFL